MERKTWRVRYNTDLDSIREVRVETEVGDSGAFSYGNGKYGALIFSDGDEIGYDLRYCNKADLHHAMLDAYYGLRLVAVKEVKL